ncbi:TetR family transcriptional regulator [Actinomadura sp. DSM 109109]|nr:TetR family transcriptional regulator [Actinomadura lepetitiana]
MRADVRRNRARLLAAARETFQRQGAGASLEGVARLAGVGIGTLYRHFPTRQDLLEALLADVYAGLAADARARLDSPSAGEALLDWLRTFIAEITTFPGMAASAMVSLRDPRLDPSGCRAEMSEAGAALLARAQRAGDAPAGAAFGDVLRLAGAIATVAERDPDAASRLLSLAAGGVAPAALR